MSHALPAPDIAATARGAGLDLAPAVAERIAVAISPAIAGFAPVAGTLPFDLEPAAFLRAQQDSAGAEAVE